MSREQEYATKSTAPKVPSPVKKYLEWKSNEKTFGYYDKESGKNVFLKLPLKFLVLKQLSCVRGFNEASNSGIYSNEVTFMSEPITVRTSKGDYKKEGVFKDMKLELKADGAKYNRNIYAMTSEGELVCVTFKGATMFAWGSFSEKVEGNTTEENAALRKRLLDEWVVVSAAESKKKGAVKYSVPVLAFDKKITAKEALKADELYEEICEFKKLSKEKEESAEEVAVETELAYVGEVEEAEEIPF